jgi:hypothetical protein
MLRENTTPQETTPQVSPGNYSPVTVDLKDTLGSLFLGVLAGLLLLGWMRAEARYRDLLMQLYRQNTE